EEHEGEASRQLVADALTMCVHQRLVGDERQLTMDVLLPSRKADDPIRAAIRDGQFNDLEGHVRSTASKKSA
ncbi:MAG: hypothetical protein AAF213_09590, partial [Pseudomonadota bacterium]